MKKLVLLIFAVLISCTQQLEKLKPIENTILYDTSSYFYVDFKNYPQSKELPIGVFDSGTGGLTVLDAIINCDNYENATNSSKPDGIRDFEKECFIYLGDKANMPYGEYAGKQKTDLLKEHIIKDAQFLLGNKYYNSASDLQSLKTKENVKAIVIACNTATAYGKEDIEKFIKTAGLDMKVIGVVGAGARGALAAINKNEDASIGVFATAGTVAANGYPNEIKGNSDRLNYSGNIQSFQQAGIGLAAAIDGEKDYLDKSLDSPRKEYKGPSLQNEKAKIDINILQRYNFDWSGNSILYIGSKDNPAALQLNSIENYISYNVVSLLEKIRTANSTPQLKAVILGCTHYPFYTKNFKNKFQEMYNYQENGEYIYRDLISPELVFIDPAINTADELYKYLNTKQLFAERSINESEFYISVPNVENTNVVLSDSQNFTYEYKYGRFAGQIQEYVKRVPFSRNNIPYEMETRLKKSIPFTFELIKNFTVNNRKTNYLSKADRFTE